MQEIEYHEMNVITLKEKFNLFSDLWSPKVIGSLNGQHVKLAKIHGDFVWHKHDEEDEMFFVVKGQFEMHFENDKKSLNEGDMIIVPKGVRHKPFAKEECWIMLFEPDKIKHTGDVLHEKTVFNYEKI